LWIEGRHSQVFIANVGIKQTVGLSANLRLGPARAGILMSSARHCPSLFSDASRGKLLAVAEVIAILEDDPDRVAAMRTSLDETLPGIEAVFFEDAQKMIAWLSERLGEIVLISLDHDLPLRDHEGMAIDCGTGRHVADYLASFPPTCPVIVHSSNNNCASGMFFALKDAGWPVSRVYPSDDTRWIADSWARQIRRLVGDG
jgi:hypothetical protein